MKTTSTPDWTRIYPTLEAVMRASFETLCAWCDNLPPPQTDVERTIMRRLKLQRETRGNQLVRQQAPEIAEQYNAILDMMDRLGIKRGARRM